MWHCPEASWNTWQYPPTHACQYSPPLMYFHIYFTAHFPNPAPGILSFLKQRVTHFDFMWPQFCVYNEAMLIYTVSLWVFFKHGERSWDMAKDVSFFLKLPLTKALTYLLFYYHQTDSQRNPWSQICVQVTGRRKAGGGGIRKRQREGGGAGEQHHWAYWNTIHFVTKGQRPTICMTWLVQESKLNSY